ncbi:GNAT family N-acetyltransferase [Saccharothrix violaceirubra]|uniref:Lysine N-acyltransferase MbtK n=1 Tax=Saccharothrix violaceirubra TaxID=413306 RepID=A0A7W7T1J0_9PSEU|nr:GNAT family N-acetyltransferase [Saccharothrix violaceirubra]MBB4964571.1 RimJ/RimL family protein N-acetyltransferase [Saccharothrix violaceirubra]
MTHLDAYRATDDLSGVPAPPVPTPDGWWLRAVDPDGPDVDLLHRWMQAPHVAAFWHQAWPRERWERELRDQLAGAHSRPCLVGRGDPVLYVEIYRAARDVVASVYPARPHDVGLHVAIGELAMTGRGLVRELLPALCEALFDADPLCTRVVLEPDVRNRRAIASFTAGGFAPVGEVLLPDKVALLMVRGR